MRYQNYIKSSYGAAAGISDSVAHNSPFWKRSMDISMVILLGVTVVGPLMAVIALYIKLVSPGPVLFKQERVGYLGRLFTCFKFRSMKVNAEVASHQHHTAELIQRADVPMVKMDRADSRLIPGGAWLRASGLDELPQFLNILRGEMSLVGPRPCVPYEYEQYQPWQKLRFQVAPGLTGLWQVSGKNRTTFSEMIEMDIEYWQNRSLWLDVKIVLKTAPAVLEQLRLNRQARTKLS